MGAMEYCVSQNLLIRPNDTHYRLNLPLQQCTDKAEVTLETLYYTRWDAAAQAGPAESERQEEV